MVEDHKPVTEVHKPILLVDDAWEVVDVLEGQLRQLGYEVVSFTDPVAAVEALQDESRGFSCVLADHDMPKLNGVELLKIAKEKQPFTSRVMISGQADLGMAMSAINEGSIFRFMVKPWDMEVLRAVIAQSVQRSVETEEKHLMQVELKSLNAELKVANDRLQLNLNQLTGFCEHLLVTFSPLLGETTRVVIAMCEEFCRLGFFDEQEQKLLRIAASFQNVGLMRASRSTVKKSFLKPQQLTQEEERVVQRHPGYAETLLDFAGELEPVSLIIRAHHERWDGSGYPDGLSRDSIPRLARFLSLACYYAECNIYREALVTKINDSAGRAFSHEAVDAFNQVVSLGKLPKKIRELRIDELRAGMVLAGGLYTLVGVLLVPRGKELTRSMVERLRSYEEENAIMSTILVYG